MPANSDLLRQVNTATVYRLLARQAPLSRIQIAEHTQLAPASVSKITRQLLARGLIAEQAQQASTGGRPATSLIPVTDRFHAIAIRLGRDDVTFACYNLNATLLAQQNYPLHNLPSQQPPLQQPPSQQPPLQQPPLQQSPSQHSSLEQPPLHHSSPQQPPLHSSLQQPHLQQPALQPAPLQQSPLQQLPLQQLPLQQPSPQQTALQQTLIAALDHFRQTVAPTLPKGELIALALTAPGLVRENPGIIDYLPPTQIQHWPLAQTLRQHTGLPCFIGHDIRSLALAEHYFGCLQGCDDAILVRIHQGTGAGILSAGNIFTARHGNAGEIGHIQVDPLGDLCHCGNFGCLETIAANAAIEHRARQRLQQGYPSSLTLQHCHIRAICQAANQQDPLACALIRHVAQHLGQALAAAINLFHPQKIVIAGEITAAHPVLFPALQTCLHRQALPAFCQHLPLIRAELNETSAIGAFALIQRALLEGPLLHSLLTPTSPAS